MSNIDDLSAKVSEAVFRQVEQDRALNRNNIQEVVRKEILADRPEESKDYKEMLGTLIEATLALTNAMRDESPRLPAGFYWSSKTIGAFSNANVTVMRIKGALR